MKNNQRAFTGQLSERDISRTKSTSSNNESTNRDNQNQINVASSSRKEDNKMETGKHASFLGKGTKGKRNDHNLNSGW